MKELKFKPKSKWAKECFELYMEKGFKVIKKFDNGELLFVNKECTLNDLDKIDTGNWTYGFRIHESELEELE